ncbi:MAG: HAMP domain-containing histidine kinase [Actinobacteria bacterium]|nr:HAMP domain-containing histidine kinase [Actinomycetota bacterium]
MVKSIRFKLTAWYVVILGLILVLFSFVAYEGVKGRLASEVSRSLQSTAFEVERLFDPSGPTLSSLPQKPSAQNTFILTYNRPGRLLESSHLDAVAAVDPRAVFVALTRGESKVSRINNKELGELVVYTIPVVRQGEVVGAVQAARSLDSYRATLGELKMALFVLVPLCLSLAAAGGLFMSTKALSPIEEITRTTREITAYNLEERISIKSKDELGRLAETINELLTRLKSAIENERRFIDDASHELRTPLTILRGEIDVALNRERRPQEYREILTDNLNKIDEMTRLVEGLLTLARLGEENSLDIEEINAKELCLDVAEQVGRGYDGAAVAINVDVNERLFVRGDRMKLKQLLVNLVDNAVKFSQKGSAVRIEASRQNDAVAISVIDSGQGISTEDLPRIFDRFYRTAQARSLEYPGSGIGLSIAKLIAKAHAGKILVKSETGKGSVFTVELPENTTQSLPDR